MDYAKEAVKKHAEWKGKIEVVSRVPVKTREELSVAYTPGVAQPCLDIQKDPELSYTYTRRANLVAVVTDGSAVLGLGNIGPLAGMPVMEGKCVLFKEFGGVDAFPICVQSQNSEDIIRAVKEISGSFGGINLEDISAPRCFEIENRLKAELDIPVFHDDQHGTAIVTLAALLNGLKIVGKKMSDISIAVSGPGSAGSAITRLLLKYGVRDVVMCDRTGILYTGREKLDWSKTELAAMTNKRGLKGGLKEAMKGADVFVGVSGPGLVDGDMVKSMAKDPIVFAMANPMPEIMPDAAAAAGAKVFGSGRSDFANQINNVLAFPGVFKGAFQVRAKAISEGMKIAAAEALAGLISAADLKADYIIPGPFDKRVAPAVSEAVAKAAVKEGLNRI
ncbi:MAG: NADP-dependent malic enzyme [Clostridiales bacterium]|jgi:malate dehydrogenase (oxaloacetate-decarboxylating)|nr:NADP-dependent malic enzyme [Clostridiales bacterium]